MPHLRLACLFVVKERATAPGLASIYLFSSDFADTRPKVSAGMTATSLNGMYMYNGQSRAR